VPLAEKYFTLLKRHGLKKTRTRMSVLEVMSKTKHALAQSEIEYQLKNIADRVTLYRLLISFEEHGIIHKMIDHAGISKYALCHNNCNEHEHHDEHVHFSCTQCNQTTCIDGAVIPAIPLPEKFKAISYHYSVNGICDACLNQ